MATKPITTVVWDNNQTNSIQPALTLRDDGYATDAVPLSSEFNYQLNSLGEWTEYLEDTTDEIIVETAGTGAVFNAMFGNLANNFNVGGVSGTQPGIATNGTGTVVIAASGYGVLVSMDYGKTWVGVAIAAETYNDITYRSSGPVWTLVGNSGLIRTASFPRAAWTSRTSNTSEHLYGVYDDGTNIVAVGANNVIRYQTDPTGSWSTGTSGVTAGTQLNDVVKGGSTWLIVGASGKAQTATTPGGTWTDRTTGVSANLYGAEYGNSTFVIGGAVASGTGTLLHTTDPTVSFTAAAVNTSTGDIRRGAYNTSSGFWFFGEASGKVLMSANSANWIRKTVHASSSIYSAVYTGAQSVVLGGTSGQSFITDDLETLRNDSDINRNMLRTAAIENTIKKATTGTAIGTTFDTSLGPCKEIFSIFGLYVTVGEVNDAVSLSGAITTNSWVSRNAAIDFYSMATDGTTYITAVGAGGGLYTSTNGTSYTSRTSGVATNLGTVLSNGGTFWVAAGNTSANVIRYNTTNPTTAWSASTSGLGGTSNFVDGAYGGGYFTLITSGGTIIRTADPSVGWTTTASGLSATNLTYVNGYFFASGSTSLYVSSDLGLTFTAIPVTTVNIGKIAYIPLFDGYNDLYLGAGEAIGDSFAVHYATNPFGPWAVATRDFIKSGTVSTNATSNKLFQYIAAENRLVQVFSGAGYYSDKILL